MKLNLFDKNTSKLYFKPYDLVDTRYSKVSLISAGVSFIKQSEPWLLNIYLEDASGRTLLDCAIISPNNEFYNYIGNPIENDLKEDITTTILNCVCLLAPAH